MIDSKYFNCLTGLCLLLAFAIAFGLVGSGSALNNTTKTTPAYATQLFGPDIITIDILADESDWQSMLDNAINEEFIAVDVVVNGTKFSNVGIRPKGNSSLSQVVSSDSDRYSFRLQFDEYVKDQTCFGLDGFVVNNMISDNSYMKEYLSYDIMAQAGVDSPYFGFADISLNGETWGFYLAVETYGDSYETRSMGDTSGMLYNVKSAELGGGNKEGQRPDRQEGQTFTHPDDLAQTPPATDGAAIQPNTQAPPTAQPDQSTGDTDTSSSVTPPTQSPDKRGGMGGMGGMGSRGGGSLEYTDDNADSYSSIFSNAVGKSSDSDYQRVIAALKALSEGQELETYFDVDQILRYLAAHTIVVNLDSYSSSMAQNYYIYEYDGRVTILPWDYNMAWGGFQSGSASAVINFPIDTPVSGVEMSTRPLLAQLFAVPEYLAAYHTYLQQLLDSYFANGAIEAKIAQLDALISPYVAADPSKFCTEADYHTAVSALTTLCSLRAQSVQGQLNGTVPSTTAGQTANPEQLISAETLQLSDLGSSMMGDHGDRGERGNGQFTKPDAGTATQPDMAPPQQADRAMPAFAPNRGTTTAQVSYTNLYLSLGALAVLLAATVAAARYRHNY